METGFLGAQDLFSTLHAPRFAAGKKLALRAQTIFPAAATLRAQGTPKKYRFAPAGIPISIAMVWMGIEIEKGVENE